MDFGKSTRTKQSVRNPSPFSGTHVIGKSQADKTALIARLILDNIHDGAGCAVFDAYGTVVDTVLPRIPRHRFKDVVLIRPHSGWPVAFNPLFDVPKDHRSRTTQTLKRTLKNIWGYNDFATPVFDDFLGHSIHAVLETQSPTLVALKWLFTSTRYRTHVLSHVKDTAIKDFWKTDYEQLSDRMRQEGTQSTLNKLRAFTGDPTVRNILGQYNPTIRFEELFDKILLIDLPIGKLGTENTKLLGSLFMSELHHAVLARTGDPFYCYIYGSRYFAPDTMIEMLDSPEDCKTAYTFVHSYLGELSRPLQDALLGSAETLVSFRIGVRDSEELAVDFSPDNLEFALHDLRPRQARIRMPGESVRVEIGELTYPEVRDAVKQIPKWSTEQYGRNPEYVEQELKAFIRRYQ